MPWQHHVANVATEIDPETGHLWYREVRLLVPRQSGKTTLLLPKFIWRAEAAHLLGGRQRMLYSAQTKQDAMDKFDEDYLEDLAASKAMRGRYRVSNNQGRKRVRFQSGSILSPTAVTVKGGHGKTLDDGTADEAWALTDNRLEQSWRPAMLTRKQAQQWVVSTAGDSKSTYLKAKVISGRALVEGQRAPGGSNSRVAYFEWSADPSADPLDPATWWACMPALGFTQDEAAVRHEAETITGGLDEFRRAYTNQWADDFLAVEWIWPKASWFRCQDEDSVRVALPALALEVAPNRSTSAVSMAAPRADGLPMVKVVRHGEGTEWLVSHVRQLVVDKGATCVVLDSVGPVSNLRDDLENELAGRVPVWVMTTPERADADASIYDAVVTEQLRHCGQQELDTAVAGVTWRKVGDRQLFDRRNSTADITPLVSASEALAGLAKFPPGSDQFVF
jgi:hypothetical protein